VRRPRQDDVATLAAAGDAGEAAEAPATLFTVGNDEIARTRSSERRTVEMSPATSRSSNARFARSDWNAAPLIRINWHGSAATRDADRVE
jgi:hypothetical protein